MKHLIFTLSLIFGSTATIADYKLTLKELETLAKQGDLKAQIELANGYRKGIGFPQDYKMAVKWFTFAAKQGDPSAQYNLGIMHSFGLGVVPNYEHAVEWYALAAEQGNALAQYNLGRLYYLGQGVSENIIYAHMWAKQSSSNGFEMGEDLTQLLTELMTTTQLEEAHKLRKECVEKHYKDC